MLTDKFGLDGWDGIVSFEVYGTNTHCFVDVSAVLCVSLSSLDSFLYIFSLVCSVHPLVHS